MSRGVTESSYHNLKLELDSFKKLKFRTWFNKLFELELDLIDSESNSSILPIEIK